MPIERLNLLAATDDVLNQVGALACLASVLALAGDDAEATALLEQARAVAAAKGSAVMQARLGELRAQPLPVELSLD